MIVRIGCASSYDMDFNDYEFEQRLRTMGVIFSHRGAEVGGGGYDFFSRSLFQLHKENAADANFIMGIDKLLANAAKKLDAKEIP